MLSIISYTIYTLFTRSFNCCGLTDRINDIALSVMNMEIHMIDFKLIGRRIKYYREQAGLTQQGLSDLLDVSASYISQIERGLSEMSLRRIDEIAELLETNLQSLVADTNMNSPDYLASEVVRKMSTLDVDKKRQIIEIINTFLPK